MSAAVVQVAREGPVAFFTVDRPEKRNALNSQVRRELLEALADARDDDEIRVVVVTGSGDRAFVAGADIAEFQERTADEQRRAMAELPLFDELAAFPKPTIAMINGWALGGGCELALACDLRIAADSARLGQPEINLALIPGGGGTQRLTRLVGPGAAMRLVLTGEPIDAEEALRIGLVEMVAPAAVLRDHVLRVATTLASRSPLAIRLAKRAINDAAPLRDGLLRERELFLAAFESDDCREGIDAFLEKREPRFTGR